MAIISIKKKRVHVADSRCGPKLRCFSIYSTDRSEYVCGTRNFAGCPRMGVCKDCRTVIAPYSITKCDWCNSTNIETNEETQNLKVVQQIMDE